MDFRLKYGTGKIDFELPIKNLSSIVEADETAGLADPVAEVYKYLRNPIGAKPLKEIAQEKRAKSVAIIVNDITRPTPFDVILPPILDELHSVGITKDQIKFYIATGIHDPHTAEQNVQIFGEELVNNYQFISHDPDGDLVNLGELSSGNTLYVNRQVYESDLIITTGVIIIHYFAGFSGGRKSILPGVAGRSTIENNHSHMVDLIEQNPPIEENPVSNEMIEAARKANVDFILNVVTNSHKEIVKVVGGDLVEAWKSGISTCAQMYKMPLEEKVDLAIVSAGGYPKDINIYQTQKALENADRATRDGGMIICLAECVEGLGEKVFESWMREAKKPEDNIDRIRIKFVIGGHKAFGISKVSAKKEVVLISGLDQETTELLFFTKKKDIQEALEYAREKLGEDFKAVIMPQAGLVQPYMQTK